jgi:hypothetical protein
MTNLSFALRMCVCGVAMAWPFAATAQTGGKSAGGSSSTSVFSGQLADGTGVKLVINGTQNSRSNPNNTINPINTIAVSFTAVTNEDPPCRPYYLSGFMKFGTEGADRGTMSGTMLRCTNPELKANCHQKDFYPVDFDATYLFSKGPPRALSITINHYPRQIWNKNDCKLFRTDKGSDKLIVREVVPPSPNGSPNSIQQTIDKVRSTITNSILDPHHLFTQ